MVLHMTPQRFYQCTKTLESKTSKVGLTAVTVGVSPCHRTGTCWYVRSGSEASRLGFSRLYTCTADTVIR